MMINSILILVDELAVGVSPSPYRVGLDLVKFAAPPYALYPMQLFGERAV